MVHGTITTPSVVRAVFIFTRESFLKEPVYDDDYQFIRDVVASKDQETDQYKGNIYTWSYNPLPPLFFKGHNIQFYLVLWLIIQFYHQLYPLSQTCMSYLKTNQIYPHDFEDKVKDSNQYET